MATSKETSLCEPCTRRNKSTPSEIFCTDCDEALCMDCLDVHGSFKAFSSHHVVNLEITQEKEFQVNKFCVYHHEKEVEFYCSDHDCLCCRACIGSEHRACSNLLPTDDAARGVKSSTLYDEVSRDLSDLSTTVCQVLGDRKMYTERINEYKTTAIQGLQKFKSDILKRINELERQVLVNTDSIHNELLSAGKKENELINAKKEEIDEIWKQFELIKNHGSERQIFLMLHSLKGCVSEKTVDIKNILQGLKTLSITYEEPKINIDSMIKTLGSISTQERPCQLDVKLSKIRQAQVLHSKKNLKSFDFMNLFNVSGSWITGIAVSKDTLAVCDWGAPKLLIYSTEGKWIENIKMASNPWGIVIDDKTNMAMATLPKNMSVQVVNMTTREAENEYKISDKCYGITMIKNMVAVGGTGKLYLLNMDGSKHKTINIGSSSLHSVKTAVNNQFICCEADGSKIHSINEEGRVVFSRYYSEIAAPIDSISDLNGNVYVLGYLSNFLVRLSDEGDIIETMLKQENKLNRPYGITFNCDYSKIFISNEEGTILVFTCTYS